MSISVYPKSMNMLPMNSVPKDGTCIVKAVITWLTLEGCPSQGKQLILVRPDSRSAQACLARQDLGHTHLAHVLKCVYTIISTRLVGAALTQSTAVYKCWM